MYRVENRVPQDLVRNSGELISTLATHTGDGTGCDCKIYEIVFFNAAMLTMLGAGCPGTAFTSCEVHHCSGECRLS